PVEPQVRRPRQVEAVRLRRDQRRPLLLGKRETHLGLVERERDGDDLLDAELQPAPDVDLIRALQARAQPPYVLDRGHLRTRRSGRRRTARPRNVARHTTARPPDASTN